MTSIESRATLGLIQSSDVPDLIAAPNLAEAVPTQEGRMKEGWKGRAPFEKSRRRLNAIVFGELRWRQRQPIPLTTIRQDYNWDYRLLASL